MPFIGKQPKVGAYQLIDSITTSATATYALTVDGSAYFPETARNLIVSLNGVTQAPDSAYTVSGSNIVFDSALTTSDVIDYILVIGDAVDIGVPSDGTVGNAQLASNIDLSGKTLTLSDNQISGDAIDGGTISNFASTGIDDNATSTALTVTDSGIAATLTTAAQPNITSVGNLSALSVTGDLTVDTNTLVVDSTNNRVGIGESNPSYLLDLKGGTNDSIRLNALSGAFIFANGSGVDKGSLSMSGGNMDIAADAGIDFYSGGSPLSGDPQVALDSSGNVGIGTSGPADKLHVYGNDSNVINVKVENANATGTYKYMAMGYGGSGGGIPAIWQSSGYIEGPNNLVLGSFGNPIKFYTNPSRLENMRLDSSGNLLVGKTASSFSVAGIELRPDSLTATRSNATTAYFNRTSSTGTVEIIQFNVNTAAAGGINTSQGGTPAFASASDERLKENITEHESELSNVMSLRPVRWNWKDKNRGKGEGFVAQELEQTSWADLVSEGDDGYKRVSGLGVVETRLIKAIQEQQAMIEDLKAEVAALKGAN